jgi:hypothetical protein
LRNLTDTATAAAAEVLAPEQLAVGVSGGISVLIHGIRLILEALISFFPTPGEGAIGALDWRPEERAKLADLHTALSKVWTAVRDSERRRRGAGGDRGVDWCERGSGGSGGGGGNSGAVVVVVVVR